MPIYLYSCSNCGAMLETIRPIDSEDVVCDCGNTMERRPTFPAMIKMKGEGGYPSRRKQVRGTAPYTSGQVKPWLESDPSKPNWLSQDARRRQEGKLIEGR